MPASRKAFSKPFPTLADAMEFENQSLSVGDEFLSDEARRVRDGEIEDPSPAYWQTLIEEFEQMRAEEEEERSLTEDSTSW